MTEIALLSLLMERPMYGTEMVAEIKRLTGNVVVMPLATLYSALHKMATKKLLNSYQQEAELGGRRRVYNITRLGREYYEKYKFDINYQALAEDETKANMTYSTLEEAFSLPLSNQPLIPEEEIPEEKRILQVTPPTATEPPQPMPKTTPYISPNDKITASAIKHKQMSINLIGTIGSADLRPLIKLNNVQAGQDFVVINQLHLWAGVINSIVYMMLNFLLSFTHTLASAYYQLVYIIFGVYLAILVAIFLFFPRLKAQYNVRKSFKIRGLITLGLIAALIVLMLIAQSPNLLWLVFFTTAPLFEMFWLLSLRKRKSFLC